MREPVVQRTGTTLMESAVAEPAELRLFAEASARLRRVVPFDGGCWFATDPATIMAISPVRVENVESGHCETYWEREFTVEDSLLFRDLARTPSGVGTLYAATSSTPGRSARYREFLAPQGYGDELRAALRVGESTWGVMDLFRDRSRPDFSPADVAAVASFAASLAASLRTLAGAGRVVPATADAPGTALFAGAQQLVSLDPGAERLFEELAGPGWADTSAALGMTPVYSAVARAIAVAEGRERGPARVRLRATSGRWLTVHASCLRSRDGQPGVVAVTIEPSKSAQIAPIIVEAYRLTAREQEITRAVARGLSNPEIAGELFVSPHTVRDHLKAIFTKVGVSSRGELVAKLFAEHYGPALHAPQASGVEHVHL